MFRIQITKPLYRFNKHIKTFNNCTQKKGAMSYYYELMIVNTNLINTLTTCTFNMKHIPVIVPCSVTFFCILRRKHFRNLVCKDALL